MVSNPSLVELIQAQIKLENTTAKRIQEFEDVTHNPAAKLLLAEMQFDTEKHAKILQTMLNLLSRYEPVVPKKLWQLETQDYVDALSAKNTLEKHIQVETQMLNHIRKAMKKTDDHALRMLFRHIADARARTKTPQDHGDNT